MKTKNYIIYYRVSTQKQGQSGLGLEAQKAAVNSFLNGRGGIAIKEFKEIESGKRNDRPQFKNAVLLAKEKNATLLVAKLDRLSRNYDFIRTLRQEGIDFLACDMPDANKLTVNIMAAIAEQEREFISDRTRAALSAAKKKGRKLGAANPKIKKALREKGFKKSLKTRRNGRKIFAESLRSKIERLRLTEKRSQRYIVDRFNEFEVPAFRGKKKWNLLQLQKILKTLEIA